MSNPQASSFPGWAHACPDAAQAREDSPLTWPALSFPFSSSLSFSPLSSPIFSPCLPSLPFPFFSFYLNLFLFLYSTSFYFVILAPFSYNPMASRLSSCPVASSLLSPFTASAPPVLAHLADQTDLP